ncbi:MAG: hypothetical protein HP490_16435 [Nitrospira sp.]|nr:hypothetical protein [Nitrospira sp.]
MRTIQLVAGFQPFDRGWEISESGDGFSLRSLGQQLRNGEVLSPRLGCEQFVVDHALDCVLEQLVTVLIRLVEGQCRSLFDLCQSDGVRPHGHSN